MSTTNLVKQNNFLALIGIVIVAIGGLFIYTYRGIFDALEKSYEVENVLQDAELRIDKTQLENAYNSFYEKEIVELKIVGSAPVPTIRDENPNE